MNPNLASKMGWNAVQVVPTEQMHMLYSNNNLCGCIYVWRQKSITQTHGSYLAQTLLSSHKETRYYKDTQKGLLCMFRYMQSAVHSKLTLIWWKEHKVTWKNVDMVSVKCPNILCGLCCWMQSLCVHVSTHFWLVWEFSACPLVPVCGAL